MNRTSLNQINYRREALRSLDKLPPFSPILNRLIASLANDDVSFNELAGLIERDTVLSGHVLRLVNSAIYGRRGTINSVRHAVSIIGINKLRNTILGLSISHIWKRMQTPAAWSGKQFNLHSVAVAMLADQIAQRVDVEYAEGAFIAGLLHDIGILVIATVFQAEFDDIVHLFNRGEHPVCECEMEVLDVSHESLSSLALEKWNLPPQICHAVNYHHRPDDDPGFLAGFRHGVGVPLSRALYVADQTADRLGITVFRDDVDPHEYPDELLREIGIEADACALLDEFQLEFEHIRATF